MSNKYSGSLPGNKFLVVWSGQFLSSIGSGMTAFALGIYIFEKTGSAVSYSLVILTAFLPGFLLRPLGGVLSDRYDRRQMIIIGDTGSAAGLVFILVLMLNGFSDLWVIYTGTLLSSVFLALQNPAFKAAVSDLVSEENYSKASGMTQLSESARYLISPAIAGYLMAVWDIKTVLFIDIATFGMAVITVYFVKFKRTSDTSEQGVINFIPGLKEGYFYLRKERGLFSLLMITSLITFFIGFLQSLLGPMVLVFTDEKTFGTAVTVMASGMLFSSFFIGFLSKGFRPLKVLSYALFCCGVFYALIGVPEGIYGITAAGFFFFASLPFVNTSLDVLIRKGTHNSFQGRVWSIVYFVSQTGMVISFSVAGFLADKFFNPLLTEKGLLTSTVGKITGTGPGRGIAFMFLLAGCGLSLVALRIRRMKLSADFEADDQTDLNQ